MYAALLCCAFISCNNNGKPPSLESKSSSYAVAPAIRNDTSVVRSGDEIFKARCIFCHGLGGNEGNAGAANLKLSLIDSLSIVQTIKNGRGKMPPFDGQFHDSEMNNLVAYVKSLRLHNQ